MAGIESMVTSRRRGWLSPRYTEVINNYFLNGFDKIKAVHSTKGYSQKTNGGSIEYIFSHPDVVEEIEKRRQEIANKFELNIDWIISRYMKIADANLGSIMMKLEESGFNLSVLTEDERYALSEFSVKYIEHQHNGDITRIKVAKVKKQDSKGALDSLARHLGMFDDKVTVKGEVTLVDRIQKGRKRLGKRKDDSD